MVLRDLTPRAGWPGALRENGDLAGGEIVLGLRSGLDLYANVKEEEFLGIVFPPEISDDVFINRGVADIFERNAILSEIKTTDDLDNFRGGYLVSE